MTYPHYPTDPIALAALTDEGWEELLQRIRETKLSYPRPIVRLMPMRNDGSPPPGERRAIILERVAKGEKKGDIAKSLGISPSLLSKILSGIRN